jgi:hypothetical protein
MKIICYTGGTCGDLLTAMIDPTDIDTASGRIILTAPRSRLKKPQAFRCDLEKDQYLDQIGQEYASIPSHDLDYHIRAGHNFISITVTDFDLAVWAANRFKQIHKPHVWEEMQKFCGATTIEEYAQRIIDYSNLVRYHTDSIVPLEKLVSGQAIDLLSRFVDTDINADIYKNWLEHQQYTG